MHTGSFERGATAGGVLWRRWAAALAGSVPAADARVVLAEVPAELARTLVQSLHFELVTYANGRVELVNRWLTVAETVLAADPRDLAATLASLSTPGRDR